jgi:alkylation response protein AidB-like acyl-CoA dehydrogenase
VSDDLAEFRNRVRQWCTDHVPADWRTAQTGVGDAEFAAFQKAWFAELHAAGFAVPHWPREWGGGMSVGEQIVLYQELAAADAPRLVLAFVGIHHAASTLLVAGTDEQRQRHLPAILDGELWVQGWRACRLVSAAGPDRPRCAQAQGHLLLPDGHDDTGHRRAPDPQRRR